MTAYVSRPVLVLGEHVVEADRIRKDILTWHPDHRHYEKIEQALTNLPGTRHYNEPYSKVAGERTHEERKATAFANLVERGTRAAQQAMDENGLEASQIDCLITASAIGDRVPGLHVHLQQTLGLRPDIRKRHDSQSACAGGALALIAAQEHLAKHPDDTVMVVVGEELSSLYQRGKTSLRDMIFKGLWGDAIAVVFVTSRPLTSGLRIDATWEFTIPKTTGRYFKETDDLGDHFASTQSSLRSVSDLAPPMREWMSRHDFDRPDFGVLHPGGPAILTRLGDELDLGPDLLQHSRDVLTEEGNLGGTTIFSVLARTHRTPPQHGDRGLVFGLGPGVTGASLIVTYTDLAAA